MQGVMEIFLGVCAGGAWLVRDCAWRCRGIETQGQGLCTRTKLGPQAPDPIHCVAAMALARREAYSKRMQFPRITRDPGVMGGKACLRGMRVTAAMIVGQIAAGRSVDDVLGDFPYLEREDVFEALRYAAWLAEGQEIGLVAGE